MEEKKRIRLIVAVAVAFGGGIYVLVLAFSGI
jgi:hypothetical protein